MSKVTAPTDGELLEKFYEQESWAHLPAEQRARLEDLLWAEEREDAEELEAEELGNQELYEADLFYQVEGWVEYPEEPCDEELENGICLLEDIISRFEKTKMEEPTWAIEAHTREEYELMLKKLVSEKVRRARQTPSKKDFMAHGYSSGYVVPMNSKKLF